MKLKYCVDYIEKGKCPSMCIFCDRYRSYHSKGVLKAIRVGFVTTLLLSLLWIAFSWLTNMELGIFAVLYGVSISAVILSCCESGPLYQMIATFFTVLGILLADTIVMWLLWEAIVVSPEAVKQPSITSIVDMVIYQLKWDPWTWLFMVVGVVDGFFIWSSHDE